MQADEYMALPFYKIASHRVGWLSLFLCSLSLTAIIMNGFENTLHRQLELAYFVPYVTYNVITKSKNQIPCSLAVLFGLL